MKIGPSIGRLKTRDTHSSKMSLSNTRTLRQHNTSQRTIIIEKEYVSFLLKSVQGLFKNESIQMTMVYIYRL